jgi:hypothetical protein
MGKGTAVALYRRASWALDALHFFPTTAARVLIASTAWLRTLCHFNFTAALWVRAAIAFACLKRHSVHLLSSRMCKKYTLWTMLQSQECGHSFFLWESSTYSVPPPLVSTTLNDLPVSPCSALAHSSSTRRDGPFVA